MCGASKTASPPSFVCSCKHVTSVARPLLAAVGAPRPARITLHLPPNVDRELRAGMRGHMRVRVTAWWRAIQLWHRRRIAVGALQSLSDRMLKDIGIDRSEIPSVVHGLGCDTSRGVRAGWRVVPERTCL
jgi:uncharacterized protein YjiS (DUF1127 family)